MVAVPVYHDQYVFVASPGSEGISSSHVHGDLISSVVEGFGVQ